MFSAAPLQDNLMVEVSIDKKIHSWSGSIEMGITQCDPDMLESPFPSSATELREGTWIMSGNSILKVSYRHTDIMPIFLRHLLKSKGSKKSQILSPIPTLHPSFLKHETQSNLTVAFPLSGLCWVI